MSENRGIFSLEEFYDLQVSGEITNIFDPFRYVKDSTQGTPYGYITGGAPGPVSTVDRIDYSNDTATAAVKGPLSSARGYNSATGNTSYGYIFGGWFPGEKSFIDRIDYSNDTATGSPKGYLTANKYGTAAAGNTDYGYITGGTPPYSSSVDRIDYSNDTANAVAKGPLAAVRRYLGAAGNATHGFFVAGITGSDYFSNINKIDYSNDTATVPVTGNLSLARSHARGAGNSTYGYFGGGLSDGDDHSTVDRVEYANDTGTSPTKGPLDIDRKKFSTVSSGSAGYYAGGEGSPSAGSSISKIDFSNDTATATPKGLMSSVRKCTAGTSSRDNAFSSSVRTQATRTEANSLPMGTNFGYMAGGGFPSKQSTVDRVDFTSDTSTMSPKGALVEAITKQGESSSTSYGYFSGGEPGRSTVVRIDYSNDTATAATKGPLSSSAEQGAGTGNDDYAYHSGRGASGIDRIDYSNDTATAATKGNLTRNSSNRAAAGSQSYGYFSNGSPSHSNLNRIDFSNDTAEALEKGNLSAPGYSSTYGLAASGNGSYGYWAGGREGSSVRSYVQRLDYSNDSANTVTKGALAYYQSGFGATGNDSYGYFGGAHNGGDSSSASPGQTSYISRIDYANDSATALSKGPLSSGRGYVSGVSSRRNGLPSMGPKTVDKGADGYAVPGSYPSAFGYGYVAAGPGASTVSRIDYSNDTATGVSKGPDDTSGAKASTSSETHGYLCGGYDPAPFSNTGINRMEYANDTAASTPKGNLTSPAGLGMSGQGLHTPSYGWIWTTYPAGPVNRIDFANDTATAPNRQTTPATLPRSGTTGNQSYAWKVGGSPESTVTFRLDYSSDTSAVSPKGNMDSPIDWPSCFGNQNYGYYGGSPGQQNPNFTRTSTHRIDYANDTATSVQKGNSPIGFGYGTGTSHNDNYGYMGTGQTGAGTYTRSIFRVDYANDTVAASPSGPTSFPASYGGTRTRAVSAADGGMTPGSPYN